MSISNVNNRKFEDKTGNININKRVSDLMATVVKNHPTMKKYSPRVRKQAQLEIAEVLRNRLNEHNDIDISNKRVSEWLDKYTPYAQASTTAFIKKVAKEKGYNNLTSEQVEYVKKALLNSMEPDEYFSWEEAGKGKAGAVRIPRHGKSLGTEDNLAAKVSTHVDWAIKKTVKNALKPENVIEFLVKHEKDLPQAIDKDNIGSYVDNVISLAQDYLYGTADKKISPKTIADINTELLYAAINANSKAKDYSGALLKKLGTSTFVDNDTRLAEIQRNLNDKIGEREGKSGGENDYPVLVGLMERFFKAVRLSMHYQTGKLGSSTYTAANNYPKIELAIREFVANSPLPTKEIISRFNKIFASSDNPEAVDMIYKPVVFNSWWAHVSRVLGLDTDVSMEILSDVLSEKSTDYEDYNKLNFERDIDKENEIRNSFEKAEKAFIKGAKIVKAEENTEKIGELIKLYLDNQEQKKRVKEQSKKDREQRKKDREEKKKVMEEKKKVMEAKQKVLNEALDTTNFDDELKKLSRSTNRHLQQTTSRLKTNVIKKADSSDKTRKDFISYRAEKNKKHTELVNASVEDFITKANKYLDDWAKEVKDKVLEEYYDDTKMQDKELKRVDKVKKEQQTKIKAEAKRMKNTELEKFRAAVYETRGGKSNGKEK